MVATFYHRSFRPNWIWRELVVVAVTNPAVGEGVADATPVVALKVAEVNTIGLGVLRFA